MASILIADDDEQIRELMRLILEKAGYDTMAATNGNQAVRDYKAKRPDLVILDIIMPEKEGIETIMELKGIDPEVKIIAISGGGKSGPENYLSMAKKLGAKATLEKPIDKNELLRVVNDILADQ